MEEDIVKGIAIAINKSFGDIPIYIDKVEQGLQQPCFFIMLLEGAETRLLGNRAKANVSLDVHYFPKQGTSECREVASTLYSALRQITLVNGNMLNCMYSHYEIKEEVLHFFVEYRPIIKYSTEKIDSMNILNSEIGLKS